MKNISIVGGGMGNPDLLTNEAFSVLQKCDEIFAFDRMADLFSPLFKNIKKCSYFELSDLVVASASENIGVLVSGDTGFYSMAKALNEKLKGICNISSFCGINSLQYLCSRLNISYQDINVVSLHGRKKSILGSLAYNRYTFVLTDKENNATKIINYLNEHITSDINVFVGQNLSMSNEKIVSGSLLDLKNFEFDNLAVMLFENKNFQNREKALFDDDFTREKTPMTKQEIRWTSVNSLSIENDDIIFDIGAGTGSVCIEMARKAYNGLVFAIERDQDAFSLLNKNKTKLGAFNVITIFDDAQKAILNLPTPTKAFIGGGGKEFFEIVKTLVQKNPDIKIVVNGISLERLTEAVSIFNTLSLQTNISCINCARSKKMGDYNLMIANNPVYVITASKNLKALDE